MAALGSVAQKDQHLEQVAGLLGTDWMRLWSLNRAIGHPDFFVHAHQVTPPLPITRGVIPQNTIIRSPCVTSLRVVQRGICDSQG
jgi:hypothetical protein